MIPFEVYYYPIPGNKYRAVIPLLDIKIQGENLNKLKKTIRRTIKNELTEEQLIKLHENPITIETEQLSAHINNSDEIIWKDQNRQEF